MGVARLLAKGWIVLCLFAGAHELHALLFSGAALAETVTHVGLSVLLFMAMGLLFLGGYGLSSGHLTELKPNHLLPHFTDLIFVLFAALSFVDQTMFAPYNITSGLATEIENAVAFALPGQRVLMDALDPLALDGGRVFASAFAWILAFILFGSSLSRIKLAAGLLSLERANRPGGLTAGAAAFLLGVLSVIGIQLLLVGTAFLYLPCDMFTTIPGRVLIGLGPLMLAYVTIAALTALMATGPDQA